MNVGGDRVQLLESVCDCHIEEVLLGSDYSGGWRCLSDRFQRLSMSEL